MLGDQPVTGRGGGKVRFVRGTGKEAVTFDEVFAVNPIRFPLSAYILRQEESLTVYFKPGSHNGR